MLCGPWRCRGVKEALGVIRLLCSHTLHVRLCQLRLASPRWTFWSLLGGEGGRLQGLTRGLGRHLAPGGHGKLVFFVSRPVHDHIVEVAGKATPRAWRLGAPKPR
jgi:hypothetical protein